MRLETRVWGSKSTPNLFTTIPAAVRDQLGVGPTDKIAWRLEGSFAELRKTTVEDPQGYAVFKQSRSASLYTTIPTAAIEQLRLTDRSRAEWELVGEKAHLRRR